jgi:hypothetical protein
MEGSGAQHRNSIICGVTLEDCLRDEDMADKVHLLCPSFLNYSVSTPTQTRELKEIQERATRLGRRHEFTIRKLYHVHETSGWNWGAANSKIRDSLRNIEQARHEETEMKDILQNIVQQPVPDTVLDFWANLLPTNIPIIPCPSNPNMQLMLPNVSRTPSVNIKDYQLVSRTQSSGTALQLLNNQQVSNQSNSVTSRPSISRTSSTSSVVGDACKSDMLSNNFFAALGRTTLDH